MVRPLQPQLPTTRFLLFHREPGECLIIAEHLRKKAGAEVDSTSVMSEAVSLIAARRFDLALIEVVLPDVVAIGLAALAANQNTPVLLLADSSSSAGHVQDLGYPFLEKPFDVDKLVVESISIMQRAQFLVGEVAVSVEKMALTMKSLTAEIAEAHRLFDLILSRLGRQRN